jgi:hypothetical protein
MSKQQKKLKRMSALIRVGDGVAIEIVRKAAPRPDGTTALEIGLDLSDAPVPDRRYLADVASVKLVEDSLHLLFGQRTIGGKSLRSLVILVLTVEGVKNFLKTCTEFGPKLHTYLDRISAAKAQLSQIEEEPEQTVAMPVSIIAASHVERDACIDFYHASPSAIRSVLQHGDANVIGIDPVVRIQLSTRLLAAVVDGIEDARKSLPQEVERDERV